MKRAFLLLPPALLLSIVAGCDGGSAAGADSSAEYTACLQAQTKALLDAAGTKQPRETAKGPFSAALLGTDGATLASVVRDDLEANMRASLENARANRIAAVRCESLRPEPGRGFQDAGAAMPSSAGSDNGSGGPKQVSGTNNQVAGVDEADFVKNDAKYIYVANGTRFRIIEAWPAESAHEIATVTVPGEARKLFVEGNRALVYSATPRQVASQGGSSGDARNSGVSAGAAPARPGGSSECTYGYDGCVPAGDGTETEISIFDISNRAAPKLVRSIHSSSSLIAARRIGNAVHTVLGEPSIADGIGWESWPRGLASDASEREISAAYDALIASNIEKIAALDVGNVLPTWTDSAGRSPDVSLFQSSMPDGTALTSVLSLDLVSDPSLKVASVISRPGWIYASADALYMAVPHQQIAGWGWYEGRTENELSTIHKFSIGTTPFATGYTGTGVVKGRVLNQFAMDDAGGFLRVATTTGHLPSPDAHSTISVFEDKAGVLEVVGQIDQIAKSEDIRSVRFDGPHGYIVTFKKTDPLFVFDLANPRAPKTLGELKIPGFSTYMHMMDETHLLTIGYDAADQGDFAFFTGVILQIFDVSDPAAPKLTHKETIGTRGSSSEALTNHLAFNYFAPKNLLALPMTICEGGNQNGGFGTEMTFSGLMVYDATTAGGFNLRGKVAHPSSSQQGGQQNEYGYNDLGCSSWWTNASSEVKRSIIMDDWVFSVSSTRIKVNNLGALSTDVKELSIQ
ncbi:MAG: beta-propeller domain-containing protein [Myxococcales bacterium]|nr:beta-propeller domain-containing protein [Myxococcales bacterium]